jgi:hypothetical protein
MSAVIKAVGISDGRALLHDLWVENFDVDAEPLVRASIIHADGSMTINCAWGGVIRLTPDPERAMRFVSTSKALQAWNTESTKRPLRPDGLPNKPMTALTVEVLPSWQS